MLHARFLTLPLVITALTAQAQIVLEVEPNNTPAQAQAISPGQQIRASFAAAVDEEWYSFTLTAPGQVHLRALNAGTLSQSTTPDTRIALYDATGTTRLAWNDDSAIIRAADCGVTVPTGSYLWRVNRKSGTGLVAYDLDFFVLPSRPIDATEAAEPNDPRQPGGAPSPMLLGDTVEGTLTLGDTDFWSFTLGSPGNVRIAALDDGGIPQLDFLGLRFFQETTPGTWVGIGTTFSDVFSHRVQLTSNGALQPGTYAVAVNSLGSSGVGPWDIASTGRYSLRTELIGVTAPVLFASTTSVQPATNACIGSNGQRPQLGYLRGETAVFNSTFVTRIENTIPSSFAAFMFGLSDTTALGGSVPLPVLLDIGGQGTQCLVRVDPQVLQIVLTDASGTGELAASFPFVAAAIGTRVFEQALCFDPTLNSTGLSVTNDASFVVGDRSF
jgi:hypothetical protein